MSDKTAFTYRIPHTAKNAIDILTKSDFAVSNVQNELVFTMRVPPKNVAIDFLTRHD